MIDKIKKLGLNERLSLNVLSTLFGTFPQVDRAQYRAMDDRAEELSADICFIPDQDNGKWYLEFVPR